MQMQPASSSIQFSTVLSAEDSPYGSLLSMAALDRSEPQDTGLHHLQVSRRRSIMLQSRDINAVVRGEWSGGKGRRMRDGPDAAVASVAAVPANKLSAMPVPAGVVRRP